MEKPKTETERLVNAIRYNLTAAQSRLTELTTHLRLEPCPACGVGGGHHAEDCPEVGQ